MCHMRPVRPPVISVRDCLLVAISIPECRRRQDVEGSTKRHLRTGNKLALLPGVRSARWQQFAQPGTAHRQPGGAYHDDRRREPGGRVLALLSGPGGVCGCVEPAGGLAGGDAAVGPEYE